MARGAGTIFKRIAKDLQITSTIVGEQFQKSITKKRRRPRNDIGQNCWPSNKGWLTFLEASVVGVLLLMFGFWNLITLNQEPDNLVCAQQTCIALGLSLLQSPENVNCFVPTVIA
jgi:hypothetical protein